MIYSLTLQATYTAVEVGLFFNDILHQQTVIIKHDATKYLMQAINKLLAENDLTLKDLSYLAANKGPGPFTTLRVVIASLNGIVFAHPITLYGLDGLDAFLDQYACTQRTTVVLLNAFNNDVYYAIQDISKLRIKGCMKIEAFLHYLATAYPAHQFYFIGNGTSLHHSFIKDMLHEQAHFSEQPIDTCSLEQLGTNGFKQWQAQEPGTHQIMPAYLKQVTVF